MGKKVRVAVGVGVGAFAVIGLAVMTPAFAAVGAITLAGAAISGTAGGVVGGGVAYATDPEDAITAAQRRTKQDTEARMKAEHAQLVAQLKREFDVIRRDIEPHQRRVQLQQAMYTVGVACLARCHALTDANVLQVREFVFGATHDALSQKVEDKLHKVADAPPTLKAAMKRALTNHPDDGHRFDETARLAATLWDPDGKDGLQGEWTQLRATGSDA